MYETHTPAEWLAFLSLGLSMASATATPYFLLVDADHFAWPNCRPLLETRAGDWLLVELANAKATVREACLNTAALIVLLTTSPKGAMA
jgi:hypothetical protein